MSAIFPPASLGFMIRHTRLMLSNYRRWTGKTLWPEDRPDEILAPEVFNAPSVLVSAGNQEDPILNYGNQKALEVWEMDWETLICTPGRHTAEALEREARAHFLETVRKQGYIDDYHGIRISRTEKRFEIRGAVVWNLVDEYGVYAGQAATFSKIYPV